jgi:hypothetical protein
MATYIITKTLYCSTTVDAASEEAAWEVADELDWDEWLIDTADISIRATEGDE